MSRLLAGPLLFAALAISAAAADPPRPLDTPLGADLDGDGGHRVVTLSREMD